MIGWPRSRGGLQWNKPEDIHSDIVSRAGAIINITSRWGVKLLRCEAFRAPWPIETSIDNPVLIGNADLKPEKITTYDTQVFYNNEKTHLAATYFQSSLTDLVVRSSLGSGTFTFDNRGEMDFQGLELEGKQHLNSNLYMLGSVTHQDSQETSQAIPTFVPNTMGKLGLGYNKKKLSLGMFYTYSSEPPNIPGSAQVNPDPDRIHWVTLNLNYDVTDWLTPERGRATFMLHAENILNEDVHHPEFYRRIVNSVPADSGVAFYAGMRLEF